MGESHPADPLPEPAGREAMGIGVKTLRGYGFIANSESFLAVILVQEARGKMGLQPAAGLLR
jgi:hypothetical protein